MKFAPLIAVSLALCAPTAVFAQSSAAPATAAKPAPDPDRKICKAEEETGSRLAKHKVCLTAAEWKDRAFKAGQWAERQQTSNSTPNGH